MKDPERPGEPFVPIVSMSQRVLPSSSKTHAVCPHCLNVSAGPPLILQTPRRLSPLSQCLSGSSPHPPNPAPFVPIVSMSQRVLPSSSEPRAVCPHCLNVSAGPPLILQTPRRLSPLSQCLSGSSPHPPNPAPFVPIVSMSQWFLPSSSKPRAVCPHCLNVPVVFFRTLEGAPLGLPTDHRFPTNAPKIPCRTPIFLISLWPGTIVPRRPPQVYSKMLRVARSCTARCSVVLACAR